MRAKLEIKKWADKTEVIPHTEVAVNTFIKNIGDVAAYNVTVHEGEIKPIGYYHIKGRKKEYFYFSLLKPQHSLNISFKFIPIAEGYMTLSIEPSVVSWTDSIRVLYDEFVSVKTNIINVNCYPARKTEELVEETIEPPPPSPLIETFDIAELEKVEEIPQVPKQITPPLPTKPSPKHPQLKPVVGTSLPEEKLDVKVQKLHEKILEWEGKVEKKEPKKIIRPKAPVSPLVPEKIQPIDSSIEVFSKSMDEMIEKVPFPLLFDQAQALFDNQQFIKSFLILKKILIMKWNEYTQKDKEIPNKPSVLRIINYPSYKLDKINIQALQFCFKVIKPFLPPSQQSLEIKELKW